MTNMNINPGGVIGAIVAVVGMIAFFALYQGEIPKRSGRLIGFAVLGCALFGNWLWQTVLGGFSSPAEDESEGSPDGASEADDADGE